MRYSIRIVVSISGFFLLMHLIERIDKYIKTLARFPLAVSIALYSMNYHLYQFDAVDLLHDFLPLIHVRCDKKCLHRKINMSSKSKIKQATVSETYSLVFYPEIINIYSRLFISTQINH